MKIEILPLEHGKVFFHEIMTGECFVHESQIYLKLGYLANNLYENAFNFDTNESVQITTKLMSFIPVRSKLVLSMRSEEIGRAHV